MAWFTNNKKTMDCPDPFEDKVKCEECKCWLDIEDSQAIRANYGQVYYCGVHRKSYSRIVSDNPFRTNNRYFREIECDKDGNPIGYKKEK